MRSSRIGLVLALGGMLLVTSGATASTSRVEGERAQPRVVYLTESTIGCSDEFQQLLCDGFRRAARRLGIAGRIVTLTAREDLRDALSLLATQDWDLVITFGIGFPEAVGAVGPRFPDARFVVMDRSSAEAKEVFGIKPPANAQWLTFRTSEAAYLAGWLAGRLERAQPGPDVVGVVGGIPILPVKDSIVGFRAGARRASPGVKVLTAYSNNFVDRSACRALARRQVARGAGVLFNVAGVCGLGTLEVAQQAGVWGIGVDTDQSFLGPHILTSVTKDFEAGFVTLLRQVKEGRIRAAGDTVLTMGDGAVGLAKVSPRVPVALRQELMRLERRIGLGKVRVPGVFPDPR